MRSWLKSTDAAFTWDDPVPGLVHLVDLAWAALHRRGAGRWSESNPPTPKPLSAPSRIRSS